VAKIVVVEDEAELAAAIAARLRSDGHSVAVAEDGPGPALGTRLALVVGHLVLAPAMFRSEGGPAPGEAAGKRAVAVAAARGTLLAIPVMITIGLLLAVADPIFRSWFGLTAAIRHLTLVLIGAWAVAGAGMRYLSAAEAIGLRRAICAQPAGKDAGAAFNLARARASEALAGACGSLRPGPATRRGP
jgi:hypothetical protein